MSCFDFYDCSVASVIQRSSLLFAVIKKSFFVGPLLLLSSLAAAQRLGDLTLLDAAGAATVYYEAGTDVVVRLVDADLVGSAAVAYSVDGVVSATLNLLPTTGDPSIYEGTIDSTVTESWSGARLTVTYEDLLGDFGGPESASTTAIFVQETVTGVLPVATTWSAVGSPYLVTGDVTVPNDLTLTIEAGAEVLFLADADDQASGNVDYASELLIEGSLMITGSAADPVVLGSSAVEPSLGDWGGIRVKAPGYDPANAGQVTPAAVAVDIAGLHLSDSVYGLSAEITEDLSVVDSKFLNVGRGIDVQGGSYTAGQISPSAVQLLRNEIRLKAGIDSIASAGGDSSAIAVSNFSHGLVLSVEGNEVTGRVSLQNIASDFYASTPVQPVVNVLNNKVLILGGTGFGLELSGVYGSVTITGNEVTGSGVGNEGYDTGFALMNSYYSVYGDQTADILMRDNHAVDVWTGFDINVADSIGSGSASPWLSLTFDANYSTGYQGSGYRFSGLQGGTITGNTATASTVSNSITMIPRVGMELSNSVPDEIAGNALTGNVTPVDPNLPGTVTPANDVTYGSAGLVVRYSDEASSQLVTINGGNTITGNDQGVRLEAYAQVLLSGNTLGDNTDFGVINLTAYEVDARGNFWGEAETLDLSTGAHPRDVPFIFDEYDDAAYGFVNYALWQTTPGSTQSPTALGDLTLLDAAGAATVYYEAGTDVVVRLVDADLVGSAAVAYSVDGVVSATLNLLPTTGDPSIYEGTIDSTVTESWSGARLTVTYEDLLGDFGGPESASTTAIFVQETVTGVLPVATTWSAVGSPYLVTGDVTVPNDLTLTIEAGAEVLFLADADDQASGNVDYASELLIEGSLMITGSAADPVVLGSSAVEPSLGDWGGIRVKAPGYDPANAGQVTPAAVAVDIAGLHLSDSVYGLSAEITEDLSVVDSKFLNVGRGIDVQGGSYTAGQISPSAVQLLRNEIRLKAGIDSIASAGGDSSAIAVSNFSHGLVLSVEGNEVTGRVSLQNIASDFYASTPVQPVVNVLNNKVLILGGTGFGLELSGVYGSVTITGNEVTGSGVGNEGYDTGFALMNSYYSVYGDQTADILMRDNHAVDVWTGFDINVADSIGSGSASPWLSLTFDANYSTGYQGSGYRFSGLQGGTITGNTATASTVSNSITMIPRVGMELSNSVPDEIAGNALTGNVTPVDPNLPGTVTPANDVTYGSAGFGGALQ